MGIIRAFTGALGGTFADQWKDIFTAGVFNEHVMVSPGIQKHSDNRNRGSNLYGSDNVITNGSKIYVPENTAAFIFADAGLESVIVEPGGYIYENGQKSVFNRDGFGASIFKQTGKRFEFGGINPDDRRIAFINLREIRDIKFGTRGAQVYNDHFYGVDLEIFAYGSFTIRITDPVLFIRNFVPPNTGFYTMDDPRARGQITSEFLQSFIVALNSLSDTYRISQLPSQSIAISKAVMKDSFNAGTWPARFGFTIVQVAIENIEFSDESRELVREFNENKMKLKAYEDVSQKASNIAAQQKIAQGIQDNGLGNGGGMLFGMNMAQGLSMNAQQKESSLSLDDQIAALQKLKTLVDSGILSQEEFDIKKKEIMGF